MGYLMRKYIIMFFILTGICCGMLFYVSQETRDARDNVASLEKSIAQEEEAIRILKAEWSYLNRPQRLEKLANKFLKLDKTKSYQFVKFDDLEVASNVVIKLPKDSNPVSVANAYSVAKIEPAAAAISAKKSTSDVIASFKDKIESLLDDSDVSRKEHEENKEKVVSKFYKNMAFRNMIGTWGND